LFTGDCSNVSPQTSGVAVLSNLSCPDQLLQGRCPRLRTAAFTSSPKESAT
jgi:hypothetical protein